MSVAILAQAISAWWACYGARAGAVMPLEDVLDAIQSRPEVRRAEKAFLRRAAVIAAAASAAKSDALHSSGGGLCRELEEVLWTVRFATGRNFQSATSLQVALQHAGDEGRILARRVKNTVRGRNLEAHPDVALANDVTEFFASQPCREAPPSGRIAGAHPSPANAVPEHASDMSFEECDEEQWLPAAEEVDECAGTNHAAESGPSTQDACEGAGMGDARVQPGGRSSLRSQNRSAPNGANPFQGKLHLILCSS